MDTSFQPAQPDPFSLQKIWALCFICAAASLASVHIADSTPFAALGTITHAAITITIAMMTICSIRMAFGLFTPNFPLFSKLGPSNLISVLDCCLSSTTGSYIGNYAATINGVCMG
jgi:hypothetical protein